ncbi:MAG: hypothetical protein ABR543_17265 [Gemmatimonadaceae bacterium]
MLDAEFGARAAWALSGAVLGSIIAWVILRSWLSREILSYTSALKHVEAAVKKRDATAKEQAALIETQESELRDLMSLRKEKTWLESELDEARREAADLAATLRAQQESEADRLAATQQTIERLETVLEDVRAELQRTSAELATQRALPRESMQDYERRLQTLEKRNERLEAELDGERRRGNERAASLTTMVSNLREAYALACAERDSAIRNSESDTHRADEAVRALTRAKEDFESRLEREHLESTDLLARFWTYVRGYRGLKPQSVSGSAGGDDTFDAENSQDRERAGAGNQAPREREVPLTQSMRPGPEAAATSRAGLADWPRKQEEINAGDELVSKGVRVNIQQVQERIRTPVSTMRVGDETLVVCDDGSVWSKRASGWVQQQDLPGTKSEIARRFTEGLRESK